MVRNLKECMHNYLNLLYVSGFVNVNQNLVQLNRMLQIRRVVIEFHNTFFNKYWFYLSKNDFIMDLLFIPLLSHFNSLRFWWIRHVNFKLASIMNFENFLKSIQTHSSFTNLKPVLIRNMYAYWICSVNDASIC